MQYNITIKDNISESIPRKLADISQQATKSATSTQKLQSMLGKSSAQNKFVNMQQRVAIGNNNVAISANRAISSIARLEAAQIRGAAKANRMAIAHSRASKSILLSSARNISAISRWMSLLGVGFSLKFVTDFIDQSTNLENKLKNITTGMLNLSRVSGEVAAAANRARSPVEAMAQTYQRIDLAVRDLGMSQAQALRITETASKALSLSGATAGETAAALLQLSQAFNKGKLDGDEFRTVMELMPTAADAIAKQMGVTRGELLKLAPEGKITAKVMSEAFTSISKTVDEKFAKLTPPISQALTVLRNKAIQAFGQFDKAHNITKTLSKGIIDLANNLDKLMTVVIGITATVGAYIVSVHGATAAQGAFNLVAKANPYILLTSLIVGATAALYAYSDQITVTQDGHITLKDIIIQAWESIKTAVVIAKQDFVQAWEIMKRSSTGVVGDIKEAFSDMWKFLKVVANGLINSFNAAFVTIGFASSDIGSAFDFVMNSMIESAETTVNFIISKFMEMVNSIRKSMYEIPGASKVLGQYSDLNTPKVDFARTNVGGRGLNTAAGREAYFNDLKGVMGAALTQDSVQDTLNHVGDGLNYLGSKIEYAWASHKEGAAQAVKNRILNGSPEDLDFNRGRLAKALGEDSASGKVKKAKERHGKAVGVEVNAQQFGETCGKAMAAEIINSHTGKRLRDTNIATYSLLNEINRGLSGTGVQYKDYGDVNSPAAQEMVKKALEKGYPVGFSSNGQGFSNSGKGHWAVMQEFKGDNFTYMDPNKGRIRNMSFDELANRPQYPQGGSGFFGPANLDKLPSRHKDEIKYLIEHRKEQEKLRKEQEKAAKETMKNYAEGVGSIAKAMTKNFEQYAKNRSEMEQYHSALDNEIELVKMASEVAEVHAGWLAYKNKFEGQATALNEKQFKQKAEQLKQLERERDIRESILNNSQIGQGRDFANAISAGKGLEGDEKNAFASALLRDFVGIDTSLLANSLNETLGLHQTYYDRLQAMREKGLIDQQQYSDVMQAIKIQEATSVLEVTSDLFANLASLSKSGNEELVAVSKAAAIAQTIFQTYAAAQLAFKQGVEIGGLPVGVIYAAGAVAQGLARVQQIQSAGAQGFMEGGYTGNGPRDAVAGVVHGQEFVMNAAATSRIGVGNLQQLQDGKNLQSYNPSNKNETKQPPPQVNVPVNMVVVSSKEEALQAMRGREGEVIFMESFEKNKNAYKALLQS